ncbi:MAG: DUF4268 domain-containing protein [Anaeroplasma sp.]
MKINLSKKEYLKLQTIFGKEPDFSRWLASDGLEYIKQSLGVEVISEGTEVKPNNKFSVDILLSVDPQYSKGEPDKIVIENQYGMTDHNHFSKLITYAVTNEAKYAVWICEEVHPEHKKAIDFLNENTNDNINFYLYKAVVERIGNSEPCFSLIPICEPNEEKKVVMSSSNKEMTDLMKFQLKFWGIFSAKIDACSKLSFKGRKPLAQHWMNLPIGSSQCNISVCAISQSNKVRLDLWIPNNKILYDKFYEIKDEVENVVGRNLIWDRKEDSKASSISYEMLDGFDIYDENKYGDYCDEIINELVEHFYKIEAIVKKIKI